MTYRLISADLVSRDPKTITWRALLTFDDGTEDDTGGHLLSEHVGVDLDGNAARDDSPEARAALRAVDPDDKAAVLAAVHLDAARVFAALNDQHMHPVVTDLLAAVTS